MKNLITSFVVLIACMSGEAQNHLDLRVGFSTMQAAEWNRTISAYNFARPWLSEKQPEIHQAADFGIGYSGVIGKGVFLTPELSYQNLKSEATTNANKVLIQMRWFTAGLGIDIYPMEFGLDTVAFGFRPFVRFGAGAAAILPRVYIGDSLAYSSNEIYNPIEWNLAFRAGAGCRIRLSGLIDLTPGFMWNYFPGAALEGFGNALHGTLQPGLNDEDNVHQFVFSLALSFRVGK
jgi:hypothetical protein